MARSNNTLIGEAFDSMRPSLGTFIMREMIRNYGNDWWGRGVLGHLYEDQRRDVAGPGVTEDTDRINSLDILLMLRLVKQAWKDVFRPVMDRRSPNWAGELIDTRNAWAHSTGNGISDDDTIRALDTMALLMDQIDPETSVAIRDYRRALMDRNPVEAEPVRQDGPSASWSAVNPNVAPAGAEPALRPWRSVVAPKADVARGKFKTAEFALDLASVAKGEAGFEYQDPKEFFSRTYITAGMRSLLTTALKRVSTTDTDDGDPVVELKTAFGGGKTHSMLAVYHLMRTSKIARELPGVAEVMDEARVPSLPDKVYVATLVGTDLDPASSKNPSFIEGKVNTLWGEMAYQLCLQKGDPKPYAIIRSADSKGVAPGADALKRLFDAIGPCVILIDEFVAYARNLYGNDDRRLPAGTFENVLSFMQQLTEAVKRTENCMLIASLPESNRELGGEGGRLALERVEHVFGRVNSIWRAATNEEGFEIVKKRLFGTYDEELALPVVDAFMDYYAADPDKFPVECRDTGYRDRMLRCYPIHPQIFDRLYEDWSTLPNFQRTRGVLRLMATVINNLWEANDADPLIMPGSIDFSDSRISEEIFQHLDPAWNAVVDTDVDGEHSIPSSIDRTNGRFSRPKAARRMARAIFLGSAPTSRGESLRGLDVSDVRLGAAVPGTNVTIYDDALAKMRDELSYLYTTGTRYWYDTHPTLEKLARDRASRQELGNIDARIVEILRQAERRTASGFRSVNVCPADGSEIPDEALLTLVITPPSKPHGRDITRSQAVAWAADCLTMRGASMRANRNMLLFVAADSTGLTDARDAVRRELAWKSINDEADALELTKHARDDAKTRLSTASARASRQTLGAYKHLIYPAQDARDAGMLDWEEATLNGSESVSKRAYDKAKDEGLIAEVFSPLFLNRDLETLLLAGRNCVGVGELWGDYCRYCYLQRLASSDVLATAIAQGATSTDYFGYADGEDGEGHFLGLRMGDRPLVDLHSGLVIAHETALKQLAFDRNQPNGSRSDDVKDHPGNPGSSPTPSNPGSGPGDQPTKIPPKPLKHDVELEATLDQWSAGSQVGQIVQEILQRLYDMNGSDTHLTLSADVHVPGGIDDATLRIVTENANSLGVTLRVE